MKSVQIPGNMEIHKISLEYLQCDIEIKPPPFEGREEGNTHTHIYSHLQSYIFITTLTHKNNTLILRNPKIRKE